jgi:hypothetical protein
MVHGLGVQLSLEKELPRPRRFRVYSLFHMQIVEFDTTVPLWGRLVFEISTQKKRGFKLGER